MALRARPLAIRLRDGVARLFTPFLAARLARNVARKKKDQWNIGYWIVAVLLLLTLQNYCGGQDRRAPCPTANSELALAEGRVAEWRGAPERRTAGVRPPSWPHRVEPDLAERLSGGPTRGWWNRFLRDVLSWIL